MRTPAWFAVVALAACAAPPDFVPGLTTRADVLLALGEPVLSFANDTVLAYSLYRMRTLVMVRPAVLYEGKAIGPRVRRSPAGAREAARVINVVAYEFDDNGILLRRSP